MPMPAASRERRNGNQDSNARRHTRRAPVVDDQDDDNDDGGDSVHVDPQEFLEMATNTMGKNNPMLVAKIMAERTEARRKKNFWKKKYEEATGEIPEDAVVLTGAEAEAYNKLHERPNFDFSKTPALLDTLENERATLTAENINFKNQTLFETYAKTSGYNVDAIGGAVKDQHLHAELGDVTVEKVGADGKKTTETKKVLKVRKANDPKAPLIPFDEHIEKNAKWYWPALKAKPESTNTNQSTTGVPPSNPRNPMVTESGPSETGSSGSRVADFIQRQNAALAAQPSPLSRGAQAPTDRGRNPTQRT